MAKLPPLPLDFGPGWTWPPNEDWDDELAQDIVGAVVLVGITYKSSDGTIERQDQFFGTVVRADRDKGILIALDGQRRGQTWNMPPDIHLLSPAGPGEYRLKSTGEVVSNPDYTATWSVQKPLTS